MELLPPSGTTAIMGILNATPDSFYDGGALSSPEAARAQAEAMVAAGAQWLDVGGESSRPGADPVSPEEELARVLPVLEAVAGLGAKVSIDTYRADTARAALAAGACLVNDISALRGDEGMAAVVAEAGCVCCLMHMRGNPKTMQDAPVYENVVDDICAFFEERIAFAEGAGIERARLWLDPGFGFGKTVEHNLEILNRLEVFQQFELPVLLGTSNKSTIGAVLDCDVDDRLEGTLATTAVGIMKGARVVRVHDVEANVRVARMVDAILKTGEG